MSMGNDAPAAAAAAAPPAAADEPLVAASQQELNGWATASLDPLSRWRTFLREHKPRFLTRQQFVARLTRDADAAHVSLPQELLDIVESFCIDSLVLCGVGKDVYVSTSDALAPLPPAAAAAAARTAQALRRGLFPATARDADVAPDQQFLPLCALSDHSKPILSLAFLRDGMLASGSFDNTVKLWRFTDPKHVVPAPWADGSPVLDPAHVCDATVTGHTGWVYSMCCTLDGTRLLTGSRDRDIRVWGWGRAGTSPFQCESVLRGHTDTVSALAVLNDGVRVVSGSDDTTLRVWDVGSGTCTHTLTGHTAAVDCVAVGGGDTFVSGSYDRSLRVWSAKTLECTATLTGVHSGAVLCAVFLPDGRLASGDAKGVIQLWAKRTFEPLLTLRHASTRPSDAHAAAAAGAGADAQAPVYSGIRSLVVLSGSEVLSAAENGDLCRWDLNTNALVSCAQAPASMTALTALSYV